MIFVRKTKVPLFDQSVLIMLGNSLIIFDAFDFEIFEISYFSLSIVQMTESCTLYVNMIRKL